MALKQINNLLFAVIVLVNLYTILTPLIPTVDFWLQQRSGERKTTLLDKISARQQQPIPDIPNVIVVPTMLLDQPILEGSKNDMYQNLDKGIWRWPTSSTPDKGGNTVLLGHRFTYANPKSVLYHLDKVETGDDIALVWENKQYLYKVIEVKIVSPSDVSILEQNQQPTLTIYTCAPLWKPVNRLVIVARLESTL
jgi:LPXTG-site transpeptidase (sortase) family protein